MQKIMFDDKYGLTKAVLEGRKTMTRRIIPEKYYEYLNAWENPVIVVPLESIPNGMTIEEFAKAWSEHDGQMRIIDVKKDPKVELIDARLELVKNIAPFKVGEVVAVAQSYLSIHEEMMDNSFGEGYGDAIYDPFRWAIVNDKPGWSNKMFVRADLMPHHIRITNVRVERLQDISDEDCLREGVQKKSDFPHKKSLPFYFDGGKHSWDNSFSTPRQAFAALIDKVSDKGTWKANPWVFVYEFELVK